MPISCTPHDLEVAAKCYCFEPEIAMAVQTYLLALAAGGSMDPNVLAAAAKSYRGLTAQQHLEIQDYLLCQLVNK